MQDGKKKRLFCYEHVWLLIGQILLLLPALLPVTTIMMVSSCSILLLCCSYWGFFFLKFSLLSLNSACFLSVCVLHLYKPSQLHDTLPTSKWENAESLNISNFLMSVTSHDNQWKTEDKENNFQNKNFLLISSTVGNKKTEGRHKALMKHLLMRKQVILGSNYKHAVERDCTGRRSCKARTWNYDWNYAAQCVLQEPLSLVCPSICSSWKHPFITELAVRMLLRSAWGSDCSHSTWHTLIHTRAHTHLSHKLSSASGYVASCEERKQGSDAGWLCCFTHTHTKTFPSYRL